MKDLLKAKEMLEDENLSIALVKGDSVYTSTLSGVAPMLNFIDEKLDLAGFSVADKIVGKAAALMFIHCGIVKVYSPVMSKKAAELFIEYGIEYEYKNLVDMIINRSGDGMCPMEETVADMTDPTAACVALKNKLLLLKSGK